MQKQFDKKEFLLCGGTYLYLLTAYLLNASSLGVYFMLASLVLVLFADYWQRGIHTIAIGKIHLFMAVFLFAAILSILPARDKSLSISMCAALVKLFISTSVLYYAYSDRKSVDSLIRVVMATGYSLVVAAVVFYGPTEIIQILTSDNVRIENEMINSNSLGMAAAASIIITVYQLLNQKGHVIGLIFAAFAIVMIAATSSRKALVMLGLGIAILVIHRIMVLDDRKKKMRWLYASLGLLVLACAALAFLPMFRGVRYRMMGLAGGLFGFGVADHSTIVRQQYVDIGIKIFKDAPILGMGIDNPRLVVNELFGKNQYLHNNFVELLAGTGLLGTVAFYSMDVYFALCFRKLYRKKDSELMLCILLAVCLLVMDFGKVSYYYKESYFYLLIIFLKIEQLQIQSGNSSVQLRIPAVNKGLRYVMDADYRFMANSDRGFYHYMDDATYLKRLFRCKLGYDLNLENPRTFNEKLQWLKLYDRKRIYTRMVDKYAVKKYVAETIGEEYIIPTLGVWRNFDDINFDALPDQFVLKCTHDSGGLVICKDKSKFDKKAARKKINRCMKKNYFWRGREWPYRRVRPRIIAEKFIQDSDGTLNDYKLMSFNGRVKCSFVCSERFTEAGLHVTFFDRKWNVMPFERHYPKSQVPIEKPQTYEKMVVLAEKLSKDIPFVRVDFYDVDGKIYFGELTFFPGSGLEEFTPLEWDYRLGYAIQLPAKDE